MKIFIKKFIKFWRIITYSVLSKSSSEVIDLLLYTILLLLYAVVSTFMLSLLLFIDPLLLNTLAKLEGLYDYPLPVLPYDPENPFPDFLLWFCYIFICPPLLGIWLLAFADLRIILFWVGSLLDESMICWFLSILNHLSPCPEEGVLKEL